MWSYSFACTAVYCQVHLFSVTVTPVFICLSHAVIFYFIVSQLETGVLSGQVFCFIFPFIICIPNHIC